jgi:hypothetical protein
VLRKEVIARAACLCEYCLVHEEDTYFGCQVDRIISEKHGVLTESENLALACTVCNRNKGSDIGSLVWESRQFVRFFNPRIDNWREHFRLEGVEIVPLTEIGIATDNILKFNDPERRMERQELAELGWYPTFEAIAVISQKM